MILADPFRLIERDVVDSTNDDLRRLIAEGAGHGTVVAARVQTAGRGRRGRPWVSEPGNLHCSLALEGGPAETAPQLAFVAAVALRDALAELAPAGQFQVKWPNDILAKGAKIAGMLLEAAGSLVIIGVGVDIAIAPLETLHPAICLKKLGSGAEPLDVLAGFCEHLAAWYALWRARGFAPVRQAWLGWAAGLALPIRVRLADGRDLEGRFDGLDESGALLLGGEHGSRERILAGDVFIIA